VTRLRLAGGMYGTVSSSFSVASWSEGGCMSSGKSSEESDDRVETGEEAMVAERCNQFIMRRIMVSVKRRVPQSKRPSLLSNIEQVIA